MNIAYKLQQNCATACVANDVINVSLFAGSVCCEPSHRRVESRCLSACVDAEGGYFEHYLFTFLNEVVFTLIENEATHHSACKQTKTPRISWERLKLDTSNLT